MSRNMKDIQEIAREFAGHDMLTFSVMKEMLHSDILSALQRSQVADGLVFQGGTALRLGYNNNRYSEDLDFARTGTQLSEAQFSAFKDILGESIQDKYGLNVRFKDPRRDLNDRSAANDIVVHRWSAVVELEDKVNARTQKIHVEIADIPAYDFEPRIINSPYSAYGAEPVVVNTSSKAEIYSDKIIAVAGRQYLKARDLWDIHFLQQTGTRPSIDLIDRKRSDYQLGTLAELVDRLQSQAEAIRTPEALDKFQQEMSRFLPMDQRNWLDKTASQALLAGVSDHVREQANALTRSPSMAPTPKRKSAIVVQESEIASAAATATVMIQLIENKSPLEAGQELAVIEQSIGKLNDALEHADISALSDTVVAQLHQLDAAIQNSNGGHLIAGQSLNEVTIATDLLKEHELISEADNSGPAPA